MNLDVRLIQVNERMVKHKLLVAVADWVQNCNGNMQVVLIKSTQTDFPHAFVHITDIDFFELILMC